MEPSLTDLQIQIDTLMDMMLRHKHAGFDRTQILPQKIYGGKVAFGGIAVAPFPVGWSITQPGGAGTQRITHNLGNTNYVVVASLAIASTGFLICHSFTETTVDIDRYNTSSSLTDGAFTFMLLLI